LTEAQKHGGYIVFSAQQDASVENPTNKQIYQVGTLAVVRQVFNETKETRILVEGLKRVKIHKFTQTKPFYKVEVENVEEVIQYSQEIEALKAAVLSQFKKAVTLGKSVPMEALINILSVDDTHSLADLIAGSLDLKLIDKQKIQCCVWARN